MKRDLNYDKTYPIVEKILVLMLLRENIGFGYLPLLEDDHALNNAIEPAEIAKASANLPQGLETPYLLVSM